VVGDEVAARQVRVQHGQAAVAGLQPARDVGRVGLALIRHDVREEARRRDVRLERGLLEDHPLHSLRARGGVGRHQRRALGHPPRDGVGLAKAAAVGQHEVGHLAARVECEELGTAAFAGQHVQVADVAALAGLPQQQRRLEAVA
jgi:hypothetical protein